MDKIGIGISILNSEIKALTASKGALDQDGQSLPNLDDLNGFAAALKAAFQGARIEGKKASIALAHPKLNHQVIEVPPVTGHKLDLIFQRRAESSKTFTGEALWSHQPALPMKTGKSALLHLCPKALVDQLSQGCQEAGLQLVRVLPTTSILSRQLKELPLKKDELALIAAETGNYTTVVIGRKDGLVCLARVLRWNWSMEPDKVKLDLTRSIGFAEEQTRLSVASVWLFGADAQAQVSGMQAALKLPVSVSPLPYSPYYWAREGAMNSPGPSGNLISNSALQAPQRHRFLVATSVLVTLLLLVAITTAVVVQVLRHRIQKATMALDNKIAELRLEKSSLEHAISEALQMEAATKILNDRELTRTPGWFLGYLGEVLPPELTLTELTLHRTNNVWKIQLAGGVSPSTNGTDTPNPALNQLSNTLMTGPFHLVFAPQPKIEKDPDLEEEAGDIVKSGGIAPASTHQSFSMEAWMQ